MNLVKNRKWWYLVSLSVIIPCVVSICLWGLKPSIDFTGGTKIEITGTTDKEAVNQIAQDNGIEEIAITPTEGGLFIRSKEQTEEVHRSFKNAIETKINGAKETKIETVGPSISKEITRNAFLSIVFASLFIIIYIGYTFRRVPKPASSWEFGIAAVMDILYDAIIILGIFSILGHFKGVEIDPLFITAVLTILGFSVHDTIVIFDRIRENLVKGNYTDFEDAVSRSVYEMLPRTISTSFLVFIILVVLYLFGGETIKYFVLALLIGVFSGTYSSILNSSILLVSYENFKLSKAKKTRV
jgi:preprotein translocase subunit SecF